jgi:hypothetical protein
MFKFKFKIKWTGSVHPFFCKTLPAVRIGEWRLGVLREKKKNAYDDRFIDSGLFV